METAKEENNDKNDKRVDTMRIIGTLYNCSDFYVCCVCTSHELKEMCATSCVLNFQNNRKISNTYKLEKI